MKSRYRAVPGLLCCLLGVAAAGQQPQDHNVTEKSADQLSAMTATCFLSTAAV